MIGEEMGVINFASRATLNGSQIFLDLFHLGKYMIFN